MGRPGLTEQGASAEGVAVGDLPGRKRQAAQAVIYFGTTAAATRAGKDALEELLNKLSARAMSALLRDGRYAFCALSTSAHFD